VLAPERPNGADGDANFSLASEIIELVVLTSDHAFLETLRAALGPSRRLWHVPSADKVGDLLLAGEVGIVVVDAQALDRAATSYISDIKRQFPDLVIVLAGDRSVETGLAGLISSGTVYRFIHKPMSPGRAKLFVEAAVRKFEEQRPLNQPPAGASSAAPPPGATRGWIIGGSMAAAVGAVAIAFLIHRKDGGADAGAADAGRLPATAGAPPAVLTRAATALAANRLLEPSGDNALELYLQVLARNPADAAARAGIAEIHERLYARAESALLEERLDQAALAIETARRAGVESGRIALLTAELAKARTQIRAARNRVKAPPPASAPADAAPDAAP
jgi:hypothetical protein